MEGHGKSAHGLHLQYRYCVRRRNIGGRGRARLQPSGKRARLFEFRYSPAPRGWTLKLTTSRICVWLSMSIVCASCSTPGIEVVFYTYDGYTFSPLEQRTIETIAADAARDAKRLLPDLPDQVIVRVNPGKRVIPETGETGSASPPNVVDWRVDPNSHGGVIAIANRQLRSTLLHEFHHLVRASKTSATSIMDVVGNEGLATAFQRDFGNAPTPWGAYPPEVGQWVKELIALPRSAAHRQWMFQHPDGRRWIGYKAGTYVVDQAMRTSGKSSSELVSASTDQILAMAFNGSAP